MDGVLPAAIGHLGQTAEPLPRREVTNGQGVAVGQEPEAVFQPSRPERGGGSFSSVPGLVQTYLRFTVDDSGQVHVKVVNASNDEVIREIPPQEVARVAAALRAYQEEALRRGAGQS